tara:strand:- start:168 stop:959 length:792 start_codon:yes stop_codon:yes gene_type:complete
MKIAFVGDSFCDDIAPDNFTKIVVNISWPHLVAKQYNAEIICKGRGGTALFHAYEDLLEIVNKADYIIFCITAFSRLPNRYGIPIDAKWLTEISWSMKKLMANVPQDLDYHNNREPTDWHHKKAIKAGELYYNDLISFEFHQVAQKGILMQMDELMIEKKKKCIWFPCFENELSMQEYIPKSGPMASHPLYIISNAEKSSDGQIVDEERYPNGVLKSEGPDDRRNHLNEEHNKKMAELIINIINKDDFTPKMIKMKDYFKVLR